MFNTCAPCAECGRLHEYSGHVDEIPDRTFNTHRQQTASAPILGELHEAHERRKAKPLVRKVSAANTRLDLPARTAQVPQALPSRLRNDARPRRAGLRRKHTAGPGSAKGVVSRYDKVTLAIIVAIVIGSLLGTSAIAYFDIGGTSTPRVAAANSSAPDAAPPHSRT
jgi:hypothetical protein